jgi:hypothetical protein
MSNSTSFDDLPIRSTLRHRPLHTNITLEEPPRTLRASLTQKAQPATTVITSAHIPHTKRSTQPAASMRQYLLLIGVGVGMILAVLLVLLMQFLIGWVSIRHDDLMYGRPRTYQVDTVVGQGDSLAHPSHFLALNLHGQVEVIEFPAGNVAHAKVYTGPHLYGQNADLTPVTLQFVDSRHDHQPDMIVLFQGEQMIFRNGGGSFHAPSVSS